MTDYSAELAAIKELRAMGATSASAGALHAQFQPLVEPEKKPSAAAERLTRKQRERIDRDQEQREMDEELGTV